MASSNPFDLLGEDDNDDPSKLIAAQQQKIAARKPVPVVAAVSKPQAKLPTKPLPPAQAVREARSSGAPSRGGVGGRGGGLGRGRGGGRGGGFGQNRDSDKENANGYMGEYGSGSVGEDGDTEKVQEKNRGWFGGPRQSFGGGRRGGYVNGEMGEDSERRPRRVFERRSGTGRGNEIKREGSGKGNWGTQKDDVATLETIEVPNSTEIQAEQDVIAFFAKEEGAENVTEEKKQDDKEMTLEEYEKIREEKRKVLQAMKTKERKVDLDKEFESMQQLSIKKENDVFIKLGSDKDSRKLRDNDRDERAKKSVSINEFLKPAEGGKYYNPGGWGRGRGRGDRGPYRSGEPVNPYQVSIKIEDPGQFPTLGGK